MKIIFFFNRMWICETNYRHKINRSMTQSNGALEATVTTVG